MQYYLQPPPQIRIPDSDQLQQFQPQNFKNTQVYVGNLDPGFSEELLWLSFKQFGKIRGIIIERNRDGKSNGFGFITFNKSEAAQSAIQQMNNQRFMNFPPYRVSKVYTKEELSKLKKNQIFISNIPFKKNDKSLVRFFSKYGTIISLQVIHNDKANICYGFLIFEKDEDLQRLLTEYENDKDKNNFNFQDRQLFIDSFKQYEQRQHENNKLYLNNFALIEDQEKFSNLTKNSLEYLNLNQCYQLKKSVHKIEILFNKINFPFVVQPPIQLPEQKQSDLNTKIMVSKLDPGITEDMLWTCFKKFGPIVGLKICKNSFGNSYGFGFIQFKNIYSANSAMLEMNHNRILNFKPITVSIVYTEEELSIIENNQIVISCIPPYENEISLYKLFNNNSIISLKIEQDDKTKLNNGYIIFKKQQDLVQFMQKVKKANNNNQDYAYKYFQQIQGQRIYIHQFKDIQKVDHTDNKLLIKNFAQLNDLEQLNIYNKCQMEWIWQEELQHQPELHGNNSVCVKVDSYLNKPYSIVSFEDQCNIKQIIDQLQQKGIDSFLLYNKFKPFPIKLQNLTPEVDEVLLDMQIEQYGIFQITEIDSQQAIIQFNEEDDAMIFLSTHSWNKNLNKFFVGGKFQEITVCQSKDIQKQFIQPSKPNRNSLNNMKNISNNQINQYQNIIQKLLDQLLTQYQSITIQDIKNNLSAFLVIPNDIKRQMLNKIMYPRVQQHLNKDQVHYTPKITDMLIDFSVFDVSDIIAFLENDHVLQQKVKQEVIFKELIKKKFYEFSSFFAQSIDKQRQQLGQLIYPRVKQHLDKDYIHYTPKITGMLLDLSVFDISDMIEFIENDQELIQRVQEAQKLIKSSNYYGTN